jgi:hypothetical protein
MSHTWTQTTAGLLNRTDLVVFMSREHDEYCRSHFAFKAPSCVWSVPDVDEFIPECVTRDEREAATMRITEGTYAQITGLVNELIDELSRRI